MRRGDPSRFWAEGGNTASPFHYQCRSSLDRFELFVVCAAMDPGSIQSAQIEVARSSSSKDKAGSAKIVDTIEEAKAMHIFRCGIALPLATLSNRCFVELPVVSPDQLHEIPWAIWGGFRIAADTASIDQVRFF